MNADRRKIYPVYPVKFSLSFSEFSLAKVFFRAFFVFFRGSIVLTHKDSEKKEKPEQNH